MAMQDAEYHSERSLPTVIDILVNATFVDAVTTNRFARSKQTCDDHRE